MEPPPLRLDGKLALVTGAGHRLGRAIALGLGEAGADVAVHYRSHAEGAAEVVAALRAEGRRAAAFSADLADPDGPRTLALTVEEKLGVPDLLVNGAGVMERRSLAELEAAAWDRTMAVNLRAPALLTREVALRLRAAGRPGAVVNVADVAGLLAWSNYLDYAVSKAGLVALTRCLARELAPDGIRVNAVAPGVIRLGTAGEVLPEVALRRVPLGRPGTAGEVVAAVVFLLSDAAAYITGQVLPVDGGRTTA